MAMTPGLLVATAAALAVMLVFSASPAEASQLNIYEGTGCSGRWAACWDRQCCNIIYTGSYRFYYNDGWPAYLYANTNDCSGTPNRVLRSSVECTNGFPFKSSKQTDVAP